MKFKTTLVQGASKDVTGIVIPPDVVEGLGGGKRAPVKVTINGYTYRSTIAVMGGKYMVGVAAENRKNAKVKGGDVIQVALELDSEPREVDVPSDLAVALKKANAFDAFSTLAYSRRKEHVRTIEEAKAPETRLRRVEKAVQAAREAKK